jgi:hypothetical protein
MRDLLSTVALVAFLWNFHYVSIELQWYSAPRLITTGTVVLCVLVFRAWQRFRNFSFNHALNFNSYNVTPLITTPSDRKLSKVKIFRKVTLGDSRNLFFWNRMHNLLKHYYIDGLDDSLILNCVTAQGVSKKLLDTFFEVSLLSYLLGEDKQKIADFSAGKAVLGNGWTVYYETVYDDRDSSEFHEIRHFFREGSFVTPDYLFVKGDRAFVIDACNGPAKINNEENPELAAKVNKYTRNMQNIAAVFVLYSGIKDSHAISMTDKPLYGIWPEPGDVLSEIVDVGKFREHLFEHHREFYAEVHTWISWARHGKIARGDKSTENARGVSELRKQKQG